MNDARDEGTRSRWREYILRVFTHNWRLKLISLLFAVILWMYAFSQDSTESTRPFPAVDITYTGQQELKERGLVLAQPMSELPLTATVTVTGSLSSLDALQANSVRAIADLSRVQQPGKVKIDVRGQASILSVKTRPDKVEVVIDRLATSEVPIQISHKGALPDGMELQSTPTASPEMLHISGPESIVQRITTAMVELNYSTMQPGEYNVALPYTFYDIDGQPVESELLEAPATVIVRSNVLLVMEKPIIIRNLAEATTGKPAEGYEVGDVKLKTNVMKVRGPEEALTNIDNLFIESIPVDGMTSSAVKQVKIIERTGVEYEFDKIEVEVVLFTSREFTGIIPVAKEGTLRDGLVLSDVPTVSVTLDGRAEYVQSLTNVKVVADCSNLGPGTHMVDCSAIIDEGITSTIKPSRIQVTIEESSP